MTCEMRELGVVKIATPCKANWWQMLGDDRVRYCTCCHLNVYNLSELTSDEARVLLKSTEGRLCVRFWARHDGTVITRDCPEGLIRRRRSYVRRLGFLAGLLALLAGWWRSREPALAALGSATAVETPPHREPFQGKVMKDFGANNPY
jgi:hypothetical protein